MNLQTLGEGLKESASDNRASSLAQDAPVAVWSRFLTACHPETETALPRAEGSLAVDNPLLRRRQALLDQTHPWNRLRRFAWIALYGNEGPPSRYADAFEALAFLYGAGMPLVEALECSGSAWDNEAGLSFCRAAQLMRQGLPLSAALAQTSTNLPAIVAPILEVGERDGYQAAALRRLIAGLRYLVAVEHGNDYAIGYGLARLLGWALRFFWRRPLPARLDTRKLSVPGAGLASRNLATGRWTRTFAILWHCGVPVSQALEVAAGTAENTFYAHLLQQAADRTRAGWSLSASLAEARLLPKNLLDVILTAETGGDLGPALDRFANLADDDGREVAGKTAFALFFGTLLLVAGICAVVALIILMIVTEKR